MSSRPENPELVEGESRGGKSRQQRLKVRGVSRDGKLTPFDSNLSYGEVNR